MMKNSFDNITALHARPFYTINTFYIIKIKYAIHGQTYYITYGNHYIKKIPSKKRLKSHFICIKICTLPIVLLQAPQPIIHCEGATGLFLLSFLSLVESQPISPLQIAHLSILKTMKQCPQSRKSQLGRKSQIHWQAQHAQQTPHVPTPHPHTIQKRKALLLVGHSLPNIEYRKRKRMLCTLPNTFEVPSPTRTTLGTLEFLY